MQSLLRSYLKKLTNLSGNNRSLLLLRLSAEQDLDLHELDFLLGKSSYYIIEQLITGKNQIPLCSIIDSRDAKSNELSRRLKNINRKDAFIFEERGAKDLYVGYPMVYGRMHDGTTIRCPLLFFPVELAEVKDQWQLKQRKDVAATFNKSFLLAYSHFNNVSISDDFLDTAFEEAVTDARAFKVILYELLKESQLELNFTTELFEDHLDFFVSYKKEDIELAYEPGQLKLFNQAVLGIFPQAGSYLVPDYEQWLSIPLSDGLESFFQAKQTEGKVFKEEQLVTPFSLDPSQELAVREVKEGNSLVVQGPPGTGKSQLICNLVADFVAAGKKVLVVCDKRAALDVVYRRLATQQMQPFVAQVHDFRNDRKMLFDLIASQVNKVEEYEKLNTQLDTVFLERNFLQNSRRIDQSVAELEEFRKALFDDSLCGLSVKELYLNSEPDAKRIGLGDLYNHFHFVANWPDFIAKFKMWVPYALRFEKEAYSFFNRIDFANLTFSDRDLMARFLKEIPQHYDAVMLQHKTLSGEAFSEQWLFDFHAVKPAVSDFVSLFENNEILEAFRFLHGKKLTDTKFAELSDQALALHQEGYETSLPETELEITRALLSDAIKAFQSVPGKLLWKLFNKNRKQVKDLLLQNRLPLTQEGLNILSGKIERRKTWEKLRVQLKKFGWPSELNLPDLDVLQVWVNNRNTAFVALSQHTSTNEVFLLKGLQKLELAQLREHVAALQQLADNYLQNRREWQKHFPEAQLLNIFAEKSFAPKALEDLLRDFDALSEMDRQRTFFDVKELELANLLVSQSGENISAADLIEQAENSLRLAWIEQIERRFPILRAVATERIALLEEQLQEAIKQKQQLSHEVLHLKLKENTYRDLEYNRLQNRVSYRDLLHQVTKKKKIWPLRELVKEYAHEIFRLVPVWLASPETVSAVFPMEECFDLVIFDEASQCFSERGLPAVYRGKQVVIAGDSKQLPPNDLYQIRFETEEEESAEQEAVSLLDLGVRYFRQRGLTGHYRSRSLDLIDFSNQHFYNNKLELLPDFKVVQQNEPAIHYHLVPGYWEKNSNMTEAEKIVALVRKLKSENPDKSIGVVTFNQKQQQLIFDLLDMEKLLKPEDLEPLFVKNIENVQGDERDIILFSVAYAPDLSGRILMNFGSLNAQGGENRLNVAVTRARFQIHVVSSIMPEQLKVEDSKNSGPKLLKEYLAYAWRVSHGEFEPVYTRQAGFSADWFLKNKLADRSKLFVKEMPFADITARNKGEYKGVILTDDDFYYNSLTAKDPHAYRYFSLTDKNWKFKRLYSRQYWADPSGFIESLNKYFYENSI